MRQIYEVNRETVERGTTGDVKAILIPVATQHDPHEAGHLVEKLQMAGVEVSRAAADFEVDGARYAAGTFVIPMTQVFARYAKDILEKQTYPEVRRSPTSPPEPPYDVTAWSLGMLLGVEHTIVTSALPDTLRLEQLTAAPKKAGGITGTGPVFTFDYAGPDAAAAINALFKQGAKVALEPARATVSGVSRRQMEDAAAAFGLDVKALATAPAAATGTLKIRAPRLAMYQPWGGGNMDEGWTRWVLEQYGFPLTTVHNDVMRAGGLREKFDVILLADQNPQSIVSGAGGSSVRPEYRGGIGERRGRGAEEVRRGRRHAHHARCGIRLRDRELPRPGPQRQARR